MIISIIVAKGLNNQIGYKNSVPWKLSDDLSNFKELTTNHTILMGRKTFESIGKPLNNRKNIMISKSYTKNINDIDIFSSIRDAVNFVYNTGETELFICGGAKIYEYFLKNNLCSKIYLTIVDYNGIADTFFPKFDIDEWHTVNEKNIVKNENNEYNGKILVLENKHKRLYQKKI